MHRSRKDTWLTVLVVAAALLLAALGWRCFGRGVLLGLLGLVQLALAAGLLWTFFGIRYEIEPDCLLARAGPFVWRVPLSGILRVFPTANPLSAPAASLERLQIDYERNGKRGFLLVSPEDKFAFLSDLAAAEPALTVEGDRARRR